MGVEQLPNVRITKSVLVGDVASDTPVFQITNPDQSIMEVEAVGEGYVVRWQNPTDTRNYFLTSQGIVDLLVSDPSIKHSKLPGSGLSWHNRDRSQATLKQNIQTFSPAVELPDIRDIDDIRFGTQFGEFSLKRDETSGSLKAGFVTHIKRPELFADFVAENSTGEVDKEVLAEVLREVGTK